MISRQLPLAQRKRQCQCQCQTFNKPYNCGGEGLLSPPLPQVPVPTPHTTKPKKSALQKKEATTNEHPQKT